MKMVTFSLCNDLGMIMTNRFKITLFLQSISLPNAYFGYGSGALCISGKNILFVSALYCPIQFIKHCGIGLD